MSNNWSAKARQIVKRILRGDLDQHIQNLSQHIQNLDRHIQVLSQGMTGAPSVSTGGSILDAYVRTFPDPQNALDIFKGEWWSYFPPPYDRLKAGDVTLFNDTRMDWGIPALGGVAGLTILELGPLEGGHSYMLEQAGAAKVVAIEANQRAYLKCLIAKEILELKHVQFLCGDFEEYLRAAPHKFDVCLALGVLYHMRNPAELIHNISKTTDKMLLWTHYYERERVMAIPHIAPKMGESIEAEYAGFSHVLHRYNYREFLDTDRFAGGSEAYSYWLDRRDLMACLRYFGFSNIAFGKEELDHVNGPAITLVATK